MDYLSNLLPGLFPVFEEILNNLKLRDWVQLLQVSKKFYRDSRFLEKFEAQLQAKQKKVIERYENKKIYYLAEVFSMLKEGRQKSVEQDYQHLEMAVSIIDNILNHYMSFKEYINLMNGIIKQLRMIGLKYNDRIMYKNDLITLGKDRFLTMSEVSIEIQHASILTHYSCGYRIPFDFKKYQKQLEKNLDHNWDISSIVIDLKYRTRRFYQVKMDTSGKNRSLAGFVLLNTVYITKYEPSQNILYIDFR